MFDYILIETKRITHLKRKNGVIIEKKKPITTIEGILRFVTADHDKIWPQFHFHGIVDKETDAFARPVKNKIAYLWYGDEK